MRLDEWPNWRFRSAVEQGVQPGSRDARLLVECEDVAVEPRQLEDRFENVLLGDAADRVLGLRDVCYLTQQFDARQSDVDRLARDEQRRVRLLHVVHDVARANRDVTFGKCDLLFGNRRAKLSFATTRQLLRDHEHVHVRVRGIY